MLPWILGSAALGAGLGGIQGYQSSGGDLGSTLRGAAGGGLMGGVTGGLGAGAGGFAASRMAGALPLQMLAKKQAMGLGLTGIEKAMMAAPAVAGGAANIGTQLASGALLAPLGAAAANLAGQAGSGALKAGAGILGMKQPGAAEYSTDALPKGSSQFGPTDPYGTPLDQLDPRGIAAGQRMMYQKNIELQRDAMRTLLPEIFNASEARSKNELQRQLAAAGVRQNILTAANMLERSQQAAQQMGANAASQAGAALTSQYQYQ
jgi:hypothetical protein